MELRYWWSTSTRTLHAYTKNTFDFSSICFRPCHHISTRLSEGGGGGGGNLKPMKCARDVCFVLPHNPSDLASRLRTFVSCRRCSLWSRVKESSYSAIYYVVLTRIPLKVWTISAKFYLLKIYSQHGNFLDTILNISLELISLSDPMIKFSGILVKVHVKPRKEG